MCLFLKLMFISPIESLVCWIKGTLQIQCCRILFAHNFNFVTTTCQEIFFNNITFWMFDISKTATLSKSILFSYCRYHFTQFQYCNPNYTHILLVLNILQLHHLSILFHNRAKAHDPPK